MKENFENMYPNENTRKEWDGKIGVAQQPSFKYSKEDRRTCRKYLRVTFLTLSIHFIIGVKWGWILG